MSKRNADHLIPARWLVPEDHTGPVIVLVTWWEPEMGHEVFVYDDGEAAREAINAPAWNQQFMTEDDDEWEIHDDVVIRVMAF